MLGSGGGFDTEFSLSYANDMVFLIDGAYGTWRGYDLGISSVPEPATTWLLGMGIGLIGLSRRK